MQDKEEIYNSFLKALTESFEEYNKKGARSNKKIIPIHKWFANYLESNLGEGYSVFSLGKGGEKTIDGKYYSKDLDITVMKKNKIIATISFKFVTSNYKQNANNYFENLLGETANIRRVDVVFGHFLVLRAKTPYYTKNNGYHHGELKKMEILNDDNISKYIKLFQDEDFPHKPDFLGIIIVDFDEKGNAKIADLNELKISIENQNILNKELSLNKFLNDFINQCKHKD